jgi:(2Fe-2S) ferredoxin
LSDKNVNDLSIDVTSPLPGSVKFYDQHLVACSGHTDWPFRAESEGFLAELKQAIEDVELPGFLRMTACEAPSEGTGTDLLLFPQNIRIFGLRAENIPELLRVLQGEKVTTLTTEALKKPVWLVCGHGRRDPRCGACGPQVQAAIQAHLAKLGMEDAVHVWRSSHLGGHRLAGVMVCYPAGNWYGRVTEGDVPALMQAELFERTPLTQLWRGRMGLTAEEQISLAGQT